MTPLRPLLLTALLCAIGPFGLAACTSDPLEVTSSKQSVLTLSAQPQSARLRAGVKTPVTLKASNKGSLPADPFTIKLALPASLEIASADADGLINPSISQATWEVKKLGAGEERAIAFEVVAPAKLGAPTAVKVTLNQGGEVQADVELVFYTDPLPQADMGGGGDMRKDTVTDMGQKVDMTVAEDMRMDVDMTPPPEQCIPSTILTCGADGTIPTQAAVVLPARPKAVGGVLTCSNQAPPMKGCYGDGSRTHIFNYCTSYEPENATEFYAHIFTTPEGQKIHWLEQKKRDGTFHFWPGINFLPLTPGQLAQPADLLAFAREDPRTGWRPEAPETFTYTDGSFAFEEPSKGKRKLIVKFNSVGIGELFDQDKPGDFVSSFGLLFMEKDGFPSHLWQCFAECNSDKSCHDLYGDRPTSTCDQTTGRCLGK